MARGPHKLTVQYTANSRRDLQEIWDWNAKVRGDRHAVGYIEFLRAETRKLASSANPGRLIESNPTLRYFTIKRRARGYGHIVVFWIDDEILHVLRYFHTSQDWERKLGGEPKLS